MQQKHITDLLEKIGERDALDPELAAAVIDRLEAVFPESGVVEAHKTSALTTHAQTFALVATILPNWSISLSGRANVNDGGWSCTIRKSALLDDDATIGVGKAAKLPMAMILALLKIARIRCKEKEA